MLFAYANAMCCALIDGVRRRRVDAGVCADAASAETATAAIAKDVNRVDERQIERMSEVLSIGVRSWAATATPSMLRADCQYGQSSPFPLVRNRSSANGLVAMRASVPAVASRSSTTRTS